jgi:ferredoxin-NADP reductase
VVPESRTVSSIYLALRIPGAGTPAPVRASSLSSAPNAGTYRVSVKQERHGTVSRYLNLHRTHHD